MKREYICICINNTYTANSVRPRPFNTFNIQTYSTLYIFIHIIYICRNEKRDMSFVYLRNMCCMWFKLKFIIRWTMRGPVGIHHCKATYHYFGMKQIDVIIQNEKCHIYVSCIYTLHIMNNEKRTMDFRCFSTMII